jgi:hypothetical protein
MYSTAAGAARARVPKMAGRAMVNFMVTLKSW